jgi:nanoRNase/pAp phosphatase (c-di-AMP/oligoRNAs hydrolase)
MDVVIQFLIDWGYLGMFLSALIAGTVVPFSSEAVLVALISMGLNPIACVLAATAGNMVNDFNYVEEMYAWAVFSYDRSTELIRGSIRSRGPIINETASHFGGGGHKPAAAFTKSELSSEDLEFIISSLAQQINALPEEKENLF